MWLKEEERDSFCVSPKILDQSAADPCEAVKWHSDAHRSISASLSALAVSTVASQQRGPEFDSTICVEFACSLYSGAFALQQSHK